MLFLLIRWERLSGLAVWPKAFFRISFFFAGSVFGSVDDAKGIIGGMWDYRLPFSRRLYFSAYGAFTISLGCAPLPKFPASPLR